jgi:hypothetical protein
MWSGTFDLFKQPVRLYLKQRDNRQEYDNYKGSAYGTLMSFALFTICLIYFMEEYKRTINFEYDDI